MTTTPDNGDFPEYQAPTRGGNALPMVLSIIAFVLASFAVAWTLMKSGKSGGLGKGLEAYDLSTPEKSMMANLQMEDNGDIQAVIDMQRKRGEKRRKEMLKTIKVEKTLDYDRSKKEKSKYGGDEDPADRYDGFDPVCKVLLVQYELKGKTKYDVRYYQKELESGMWFSTFESSYSLPKDLQKEVQEWERKGRPERKFGINKSP